MVMFCVKNKKTGKVRMSSRTPNRSTARAECARLNRETGSRNFTVVQCR